MIKRDGSKLKRCICFVLVVILLTVGIIYYLQRGYAHKDGYFIPDYKRVSITESTDYTTLFEQTGLNKSAIDKLKSQGKFSKVLDAQENLFNPPKSQCNDMFTFLIKEDRMEKSGTDFVDLQPGDILISLSTHTLGWRHGHAGLVIDKDSVLESEVVGTRSKINPIDHFSTYSNYAQLRIKGVTKEQQKEMVTFAKQHLVGVPYGLTSGFLGDKALPYDSKFFRVQCSYLVWYAWNYMGYDIDSDGGSLVTSYDILHSDKVEVVQLFGMNPKEFTE